ncbi:MAG: hypothetical protein WKF84_06700 [Pyrinomonadaceae bacterium]
MSLISTSNASSANASSAAAGRTCRFHLRPAAFEYDLQQLTRVRYVVNDKHT